MKKPDFPIPRIIRENFLPEQDPLMNYRIKKVTKGDDKVSYYPQKKILWFWWNIGPADGYGNENWAHSRIFTDYQTMQKNKVEYLLPDSSKSVPQPPPNLIQR